MRKERLRRVKKCARAQLLTTGDAARFPGPNWAAKLRGGVVRRIMRRVRRFHRTRVYREHLCHKHFRGTAKWPCGHFAIKDKMTGWQFNLRLADFMYFVSMVSFLHWWGPCSTPTFMLLVLYTVTSRPDGVKSWMTSSAYEVDCKATCDAGSQPLRHSNHIPVCRPFTSTASLPPVNTKFTELCKYEGGNY